MSINENTNPTRLNFHHDRRLSRKERQHYEGHGHSSVGNAEDQSPFARAIRQSRYLMVTGRQVYCPRPPIFPDEARIPVSAGLALMRLGPHDIRPELITLAGGQRTCDVAPVQTYCRNYLRAYCNRTNRQVADDILHLIARAALSTWLFRTKAPSLGEQARNFQMRKETFCRLLGVVHRMLSKRYREAVAHYGLVMSSNLGVGTGTEGFGAYWLYRMKHSNKTARLPSNRAENNLLPESSAAENAPHDRNLFDEETQHEIIGSTGADLRATGAALRIEDARRPRTAIDR